MKFTVAAKDLQQQMNAVNKVINSRNAMTILDNFLLTVKGDKMTIMGSDQENVLVAEIELTESDGDGAVAIPAKRLLDILKEVPPQPVTFDINESTLEVDMRFQNGFFNLMALAAEEFPLPASHAEDSINFTLRAKDVVAGIENTLFAVSTETLRPIMTGILWDVKSDCTCFVSTDTHKLVKYCTKAMHPGFERQFVMPAKPANILRSLIKDTEGEIAVTMDSKSATFRFENFTLSCRFINGVFPPYDRVIPTTNPFTMIVDRQLMLSAMRRVSLSASMASGLIKMEIEDGRVNLSSQDPDYGTSAKEVVVCEYEGDPMVIGFNSDYMIEVLSNLKTDQVIVKLSDPARPGLFTPDNNSEEESVVMLVMPIQVVY